MNDIVEKKLIKPTGIYTLVRPVEEEYLQFVENKSSDFYYKMIDIQSKGKLPYIHSPG